MTESAQPSANRQEMPIPAHLAGSLIATAARAPSVHNTQPWRFRAGPHGLELRADQRRKLRRTDPDGREMLISCGAALFGLRLAVRELGYLPAVSLLPDPAKPGLLARLRLGAAAPITADERHLLTAMPHRHTFRGEFAPEPIPAGVLAAMCGAALAEDATLVLIEDAASFRQLTELMSAADGERPRTTAGLAEVQHWTRPAGSMARDGIPARAFPAARRPVTGRLPQRDFDAGRGLGQLDGGSGPPAATAILTTAADGPADWLRAGQALHRLLLDAASHWVFASLHSQPLETPEFRARIRARLALPGIPQMLLQLGRLHVAAPTARRPAAEFVD
jgi:hypothetical protein